METGQKEMPVTPARLLAYLAELGIQYENTAHPAVFTAEEGENTGKIFPACIVKTCFAKTPKANYG